MKKSIFFVFAALIGILVVSSCKKDETVGPPTLNFIGGAGYVDEDATLPAGDLYKVGIAASSNIETGEKLVSLRVTRTMNNITFADSTYELNDAAFNADFTLNGQQGGQMETITFVLTDKADQRATKSLNITYESEGVAVVKTTGVMMGSFNDDYGSFYSNTTHMTYSIAEASAQQADIDFLYYYGAMNLGTIASPADEQANTVYAIGNWSVKNATLFAATDLTVAEFDAIGDTYQFPAFTGSASSYNQLEAGDVIMFKTVGEKVGYIKINEVTSRGDYASIDVIVAE